MLKSTSRTGYSARCSWSSSEIVVNWATLYEAEFVRGQGDRPPKELEGTMAASWSLGCGGQRNLRGVHPSDGIVSDSEGVPRRLGTCTTKMRNQLGALARANAAKKMASQQNAQRFD